MFVINADSSNNKGFTNLSLGQPDVQFNGTTYNMFDGVGCNYCGCTIGDYGYWCGFSGNLDCWRCTETGWNGCELGVNSIIQCGIANSLDGDVIYPCNVICDWCVSNNKSFYASNTYRICACFCKTGGADFCKNFTIPEKLTYSLVGKRRFEAGLCVGKEIVGYLGMLMFDKPVGTSNYNASLGCICPVSFGYVCVNIPFYVEMGLIHNDGTTDCFYECIIYSSKPILTFDGTYCVLSCETTCGCGCGFAFNRCSNSSICNFNINLIYGNIYTCGLTTQQGDRLYLRFGNHLAEGTLCYHHESNCFGSLSYIGTELYGGTARKYGGRDTGNNNGYYCCNCCCFVNNTCGSMPNWTQQSNLSTAPYTCCNERRSIGLQFSIE